MPGPPKDKRPPLVVAFEWVMQITTVGLEMALPAGLGYLLDQRWSTGPWLVSCGAVVGFAVGMNHLLKIANAQDRKTRLGRDGKRDAG